jgi:hypothetical protein
MGDSRQRKSHLPPEKVLVRGSTPADRQSRNKGVLALVEFIDAP